MKNLRLLCAWTFPIWGTTVLLFGVSAAFYYLWPWTVLSWLLTALLLWAFVEGWRVRTRALRGKRFGSPHPVVHRPGSSPRHPGRYR